jgi:hypothetical protein
MGIKFDTKRKSNKITRDEIKNKLRKGKNNNTKNKD